jgi:hypothetical protein
MEDMKQADLENTTVLASLILKHIVSKSLHSAIKCQPHYTLTRSGISNSSPRSFSLPFPSEDAGERASPRPTATMIRVSLTLYTTPSADLDDFGALLALAEEDTCSVNCARSPGRNECGGNSGVE